MRDAYDADIALLAKSIRAPRLPREVDKLDIHGAPDCGTTSYNLRTVEQLRKWAAKCAPSARIVLSPRKGSRAVRLLNTGLTEWGTGEAPVYITIEPDGAVEMSATPAIAKPGDIAVQYDTLFMSSASRLRLSKLGK